MEDNPYRKINEMMKQFAVEDQPVFFRFGICTKDEEDPIQVMNVGGIEYKSGKGELMRAKGLGLKKGEKYLLLPMGEDEKMIILAELEEL